jgi:hypothetical protein
MDVYDPGHENWMFDYVWPRMEPAFAHIIDMARQSHPEAQIAGAAIKQRYPRMSASVEILEKSTPEGREKFVALLMDCSPRFVLLPSQNRIKGNERQITCGAELWKGRKQNARLILQGPSVEFSLADEVTVRRQLDQWIDASTLFIQSSEGLILQQLRLAD